MNDTDILYKELSTIRRELKNIRQEVIKLRAQLKSETEEIRKFVSEQNHAEKKMETIIAQDDSSFKMVPIGIISSCFKSKNGIPRQPSLCKAAKATLEINKTFFTNPEHSLIGLREFSYIWILFIFNKNGPESSVKAKVHPPRLNGASVGVFSTRSPHRPSAIGLSLIKLDDIIDSTLYLSGIDMLDGTPVLDIKPYIPSYDTPKMYNDIGSDEVNIFQEDERNLVDSEANKSSIEGKNPDTFNRRNETKEFDNYNQDQDVKHTIIYEEFKEKASATSIGTLLKMPLTQLEVIFTLRAEKDIEKFHSPNHNSKCEYCLNFIEGLFEAKQAIIEILQNDPRSVYRRNKCSDKLYFFQIDRLHVTCWFDNTIAEVLRINPSKSNSSIVKLNM